MLQKIITVRITEKDLFPITPHYNDVLKRSKGVYAAFAMHPNQVSNKSDFINRKSEECPIYPHTRNTDVFLEVETRSRLDTCSPMEGLTKILFLRYLIGSHDQSARRSEPVFSRFF